VEATEASLLETLAFAAPDVESTATAPNTESISTARPARCLLLWNEKDEPVGMAMYYFTFSTWRSRPGIHLEDLYVRPTERKKGYGKRLLVELAKEVVSMEGTRLEWIVLKWNKPSIDFYESIGAEMMNEWVGMRVDRDNLTNLAGMLD
jgi:GNAT superfamily N-acetyltransferase